MEFKINNDNWQIKELNKEKMRELWNEITGEDTCVVCRRHPQVC